MSRVAVVAVLLLSAATARADVCEEGRAALKAKDVTRASITVEECLAVDPDAGAALQAAVDQQAEAKGYSVIGIVTKPTGGTVVVDTAADRPFVAPRTVWVASGYHEIDALQDGVAVAGSTFRIGEGSRAVILVEFPKAATDGGVKELDFGEDGGPPELTTGAPADEKFKSLLPDRYLKGVAAEGEGGGAGEPRAWWRLALGVGMRTVTAAPGGLVIEVERRVAVGGPWWIAGDVQLLGGYAPDSEMGEAGGLVVQGSAAAIVQVALPFGTRVGVGPSVAAVSAPFDGGGTTFGGSFTGELARRRYTLGLRVDAPVLATDHHAVTGALLFGVRW